MALIAFDAVSGGNTGGATSLTYSHTCTGSDRYLWVVVNTGNVGVTVTGVTYAGVAMTLQYQNNPGLQNMALYKMANPASGANNVVCSFSGSAAAASSSGSWTGAGQTGNPEAVLASGALSNTDPFSTSVTTIGDNSWALLFVAVNNSSAASITAGTSTTKRRADTNVANSISTAIFDSNAPVTPPGSRTLQSNQGTGNYTAYILSMKREPTTFTSTTTESVSLSEVIKASVGVNVRESVSATETYAVRAPAQGWSRQQKSSGGGWTNQSKS